MSAIEPISDSEFARFKTLIYDAAGIHMAPEKKTLVAGRLAKRVSHYGLRTYGQYYRLVTGGQHPGEFQVMVDLLTTNETYFFREPQHFDFLREQVLNQWRGGSFRVWSAACSSGEEVYTLAMVLAEELGARPWEVVGSDISSRVLEGCRRAIYPITRLGNMSEYYLHKYCLKGVRSQDGVFLIDKKLRANCRFEQINLMQSLPNLGQFDVIFVRNVMIYFDAPTKQKVIAKLLQHLKPGGFIVVSHSETLHSISRDVEMVKPSIYRKVSG